LSKAEPASRQQPSSQPATSKAGSKAAEPAGRQAKPASRQRGQPVQGAYIMCRVLGCASCART
jgi:hypothetical protein